MLENIRIVLIGTTHPGNIGAVARAMKNMGLTDLVLVEPKIFPHADATARASGADNLLASARVTNDLNEALEGCRLVMGTSARDRRVSWPTVEPREAAEQSVAEAPNGKVALVFGREHSGLSNEELDACHKLITIPTNPDFSSLNLGAAVQVMTYEVRMAWLNANPDERVVHEDDPPAEAQAMEGFYGHLQDTLLELRFLKPQQPEHLMRQLRRLFNRCRPSQVEVNILRGILSAAQGAKLKKKSTPD